VGGGGLLADSSFWGGRLRCLRCGQRRKREGRDDPNHSSLPGFRCEPEKGNVSNEDVKRKKREGGVGKETASSHAK